MTVLDAGKTQHKVRLAGIDAPELTQPFGDRSRQNLAALAFGKDVTVQWDKRDRYGRIVGKVMVEARDAPCRGTSDCHDSRRRNNGHSRSSTSRADSQFGSLPYPGSVVTVPEWCKQLRFLLPRRGWAQSEQIPLLARSSP